MKKYLIPVLTFLSSVSAADAQAVWSRQHLDAVKASGLYELACYVDEAKATEYRGMADAILTNLARDYTFRSDEGEGFLLKHSTGHHPGGSEIDVPLVYADYYYLEALLRKRDINKQLAHGLK